MKDLTKQYETAKQNSIELMKMGQISDYLNSLIEVNKYKKLMLAISLTNQFKASIWNQNLWNNNPSVV